MATQANRPRAFALVEVLAAFLVLVPLACALIVMAERSRRNAMASDDLANLRQIGQLTGQYGGSPTKPVAGGGCTPIHQCPRGGRRRSPEPGRPENLCNIAAADAYH